MLGVKLSFDFSIICTEYLANVISYHVCPKMYSNSRIKHFSLHYKQKKPNCSRLIYNWIKAKIKRNKKK